MSSELERLHEKIRVCRKCELWKTRIKVVPGEGSDKAEIMFVGEAPGRMEDLQGRPFVGRAGKLLDELLSSIGIERKDVFITSPLKCRPPENRMPKQREIKACFPYLKKQIGFINPKIIVLLGNVALKTLLDKSGITKIHGKAIRHDDVVYFPTFHPAAGLRSVKKKSSLQQDFKKLKNLSNKIQ